MTIKFVPQDCWIGAYWKREVNEVYSGLGWVPVTITTIYICLVPMLPIIITRVKNQNRPPGEVERK